MSRNLIYTALFASALLLTATYSIQSCRNATEKKVTAEPTAGNGGFVGESACRSCHEKEYAEWKKSDHFNAMHVAGDSTVLGPFEGETYSANGITSTFFKRDGKFFINTENREGKNEDFVVKYTFGIYPLQQYLIEFPKGKMQSSRQSWDVKNQRWLHQYPGEQLDHRDWLHWTGGAQTWNVMCASCHSTNLRMNYSAKEDSFHTTWSVINVSCESCHGPGQKHVEYISSAAYGAGKKVSGSFLVFHRGHSSAEQLATCAPCHSRRMTIDESPFESLELMNYYIPEVPRLPMYHADGQFNEEAYEYASFAQSAMYGNNVKCNDCHNPHSGELVRAGNALCLQCHEKKLDAPAHFFHPVNSEGAQCINCHMPGKYYMVNDLRRDHSFRVPRPDQSVKYGTPNACNQCHSDQTAQWAADQIVKWYGPERKYHFSDDLLPATLGNSQSAIHLQNLCRPDTNVPSLIHATALYYMTSFYEEKNIIFLNQALAHRDPMVRYQALRSLRFYPVQQWYSKALPLLADPVKAVRIAAADLLIEQGDSLEASSLPAFNQGKQELNAFLLMQSMFPTGRMMMGDLQSRLRNYAEAEQDYLVALKMDSLLVPARMNLATLYDLIGQPQKALDQLKIAAMLEPANAEVQYYLALAYVAVNEWDAAVKCFGLATATTTNPRVFYNYGLLLQQLKRDGEAEKIYRRGLALDPENRDLNYVLALFYYQRQRSAEALPYALRLMQQSPQDPNVQQLVQALQAD
jgi:predicted CXXCH cytochrome family protein